MIVVDSSVVVAALAGNSDLGGRAAARLGSDDIAAPHLVDFEVASALRGLVLGTRLTPAGARRAIRRLGRLAIERVAGRPLLHRAFELGENLTVYDASYVALAEILGCTLVTLDGRLAAAPGRRCEVDLLR